jgi:hypothetical protein
MPMMIATSIVVVAEDCRVVALPCIVCTTMATIHIVIGGVGSAILGRRRRRRRRRRRQRGCHHRQ